ncbi:MAG: hypothetical protein JHC61_09460 [Burkholderiaceae bacterium]|nr:hypothetical protein [Burkholderiaceae bacterium]
MRPAIQQQARQDAESRKPAVGVATASAPHVDRAYRIDGWQVNTELLDADYIFVGAFMQ